MLFCAEYKNATALIRLRHTVSSPDAQCPGLRVTGLGLGRSRDVFDSSRGYGRVQPECAICVWCACGRSDTSGTLEIVMRFVQSDGVI